MVVSRGAQRGRPAGGRRNPGGRRDGGPPSPLGEQVSIDERLVLAPRNGRWRLDGTPPAEEDEEILAGRTLGLVHTADGEQVPVRSRFSGVRAAISSPTAPP